MRAKASRAPNLLTQESVAAKGSESPTSVNLAENLHTPETNHFLLKHAELAPLVKEAVDHLRQIIPDSRPKLSLRVDPEYGDDEQLFMGISTSLPESEAIVALRRFDREWWVHNARRADGLLCIDLYQE